MAATRQKVPPLEVWQDEHTFEATAKSEQVDDALLGALGPLSDVSNRHNVQLNPSTSSASGSSPSKRDSSPLRPISSHQLKDYRISPPCRRITFPTDSPQKNGGFYTMYQHVAPKPERSLYPQFPAPSHDKENAFEHASFSEFSTSLRSDVDYGYKGPMKRTPTDTAPLRQVKQQKLSDDSLELPRPEDLPGMSDDGTKPPHSYAELIGMAILRAPNRRLTLAQIYKWISDTFSYYQRSEGGWQNSIRHNLSLNKNFVKQERPKDDPGKGNYWAIKPGEERVYLMGKKPLRKIVNADGSAYTHGLPMPNMSDPVNFRSGSAPAIGNFTVGPHSSARKAEIKDIDSAKFPDEADLSSDGTIPASDPALQDDDRNEDDDATAMPPPPTHLRSSPPPADICSSPPSMSRRNGTPPVPPRMPSSSRSAGRRRKFAGMNDSGYWSSIESSAARGAAQQLAPEELRTHRIKKGRAEAEIARIRSSSFDSPAKDQHRFHGVSGHFDSSPTHNDSHPLTPAVMFKRPPRPAPITSPNTNLQDHRNRLRALLGSPAKTFSPVADANSWSPAFTLTEENPVSLASFISPYKQGKTPYRAAPESPSVAYIFNNAAFDIFIDAPGGDTAARGSPEKRGNRRPSLARAATSTGILADITGVKGNGGLMLQSSGGSSCSLSPFMVKTTPLKSPTKLGSPLKQSHQPPASMPTDETKWLEVSLGEENFPTGPTMSNEDVAKLFGVDLHSDGSEEGIDLFQDFGKIGQSVQSAAPDRSTGSPVRRTNMGPPARPAPRPAFGRSSSNRW